MKRAAAFFLSYSPGEDRYPVVVGDRTVYVRGVELGDGSVEVALDEAGDYKRAGEHVMNSHYIQ